MLSILILIDIILIVMDVLIVIYSRWNNYYDCVLLAI